jgi:hypothetical protein
MMHTVSLKRQCITCQISWEASVRVAEVERIRLVELVQVALRLLAPHPKT